MNIILCLLPFNSDQDTEALAEQNNNMTHQDAMHPPTSRLNTGRSSTNPSRIKSSDVDPTAKMIVSEYDPVLVSCHADSFIRFWDTKVCQIDLFGSWKYFGNHKSGVVLPI